MSQNPPNNSSLSDAHDFPPADPEVGLSRREVRNVPRKLEEYLHTGMSRYSVYTYCIYIYKYCKFINIY